VTADAKPPQPRWGVICEFYVSLHDDRPNALVHMHAIQGKQCKALHAVQLTLLPEGSRIREDKKQ
jgi:hypothetical protein